MAEKSGSELMHRRADAVANRRRLLDAARSAFAELGTNAEVKDIAERAGVGVGTIYRHFANKEDLLREVILEATAEFEQDTRDSDGSAEDPLKALRVYLTALLTATENYGWLFDAALGGHLPEHVTEALDDRSPDVQLMALLADGVQRGVFDSKLDLPIAANMLVGLTVSWKYGKLRDRMTLDEAVERTINLFLAGASG